MKDKYDFNILLNKALKLEKSGNFLLAKDIYEDILKKFPFEPESYIYFSKFIQKFNNSNSLDINILLENIFEKFPYKNDTNNVEFLTIFAEIKYKLEKYKEAEAILLKILNIANEEINIDGVYFYLSVIKSQEKDFKTALHYLKKIEKTYYFEDYNLMMGKIYLLIGNLFEAIKYLKKYYENGNQNNFLALYFLGIAYFELGIYDVSLIYIKKILKEEEYFKEFLSYEFYFFVCELFFRNGDNENAFKYGLKCLSYTNDDALVNLRLEYLKKLLDKGDIK